MNWLCNFCGENSFFIAGYLGSISRNSRDSPAAYVKLAKNDIINSGDISNISKMKSKLNFHLIIKPH